MPDLLRAIAEWNRLTAAATASRQLFGNFVGTLPHVGRWSTGSCHPRLVAGRRRRFAPLAVRRYRKLGG